MGNAVLSHTIKDIHRDITEKIVAAIEKGAGTCTMPWHRALKGRPENARTGSLYRGVNVLALWVDSIERGYPSLHFASYRQWLELGAQVRKGERGSQILFYKKLETEEEGEEDKPTRRFVIRGSTVFNAAQVDGWTPPEVPQQSKVQRLQHVEQLVAKTKATIREGRYQIACYDSALDVIDMPARGAFTGTKTSTPTESFYAVLCHELTHWSGHKDRMARDMKNRFGDAGYAMEELVAELGAAFLCADLGLASEPRLDHAAYIADWLKALRRDPKALTVAAGKASAAAEYITAFGAQES
jgi:antirestriction protein ArdC